MSPNKVEVFQSKAKVVKLLIFSVVFLMIGVWLMIKQPEISNAFFNNTIVKNFAAFGSTIMGLLGVYFFSRKLIDKRPTVIISEKGIIENGSIYSFGLIPWQEITSIYEASVAVPMNSKQRFITVEIEHPETYISRESNPIKRKLLALNAKNYGSPIHISTNTLDIKHDELFELMVGAFHLYKRKLN